MRSESCVLCLKRKSKLIALTLEKHVHYTLEMSKIWRQLSRKNCDGDRTKHQMKRFTPSVYVSLFHSSDFLCRREFLKAACVQCLTWGIIWKLYVVRVHIWIALFSNFVERSHAIRELQRYFDFCLFHKQYWGFVRRKMVGSSTPPLQLAETHTELCTH